MIEESGGNHPVTFEAPVSVRTRGPRRLVEAGDDVLGVEGPVRAALDVAPGRHPPPRQQVGVMLDHGGEHHVVGLEPQTVGELVEGFGGVATQDGDVTGSPGAPAGEGEGGGPCRLVGGGGEAGLVARPAVHARVHRDELLDGGHHRRESAGRGGRVEVHVAALGAVDAGDEQVVAHQSGGWVRRAGGSTRCVTGEVYERTVAPPRSTGRYHRPRWNTSSTILTQCTTARSSTPGEDVGPDVAESPGVSTTTTSSSRTPPGLDEDFAVSELEAEFDLVDGADLDADGARRRNRAGRWSRARRCRRAR